jgi:signal transduction histidine kinase/ligand-binding sensor domain-containing protein
MRKICILLALFLFAPGYLHNCLGQLQEFYHFRKYSQTDGLSSYNITKILEDQFGFIWISTQDGLNCFDGKRFLVFNQQSDPAHRLKGNTIMDMAEDRQRKLIWLITSNGGLQSVATGTQTVMSLDERDQVALSFKDKWLHSVAVCGDVLWIGAYSGLFAYDLSQHAFIQLPELPDDFPSLSEIKIGKLLADDQKRIWACCDEGGVLLLDGRTGRMISQLPAEDMNTADSRKSILFWNVSGGAGNEVFLCTNWGLRQLRVANNKLLLKQRNNRSVINTKEVLSCAMDTAGNLWVSDVYHLYKEEQQTGRITRISERNNESDAWQTAIYSLYFDSSNRLWMGSEEGLSYCSLRKQSFEKFYRSSAFNTKIQHAFSIYPLNDSIVYCGAANGLYEVNTNTDLIRQLHTGASCYLIAPITHDDILVSNSEGLFVITKGKLLRSKQLFPELAPLESDLFCAMVRYNSDIVLLGSQLRKGLYVWDQRSRKITKYNSENGLLLDQENISSIYKDMQGKVWVLSTNSLSQFDPLTGTSSRQVIGGTASSQTSDILLDMCETSNSYWFAVYGKGLVETDKKLQLKRVISKTSGLSNNGVYKVFAVSDSVILVTSNDGLAVVNVRSNKIRNYYEQDGLQSNSFEQFCGYSKSPDTIYAGGVNGFSVIYPRNFSMNTTPPGLYINQIRTDATSGSRDTTNLQMTSLKIPSDVYQTTIFFTGMNFNNPERVRYAYRIPEISDKWTDIGGQHYIPLMDLHPGEYTVQIKAGNEDDIWTDHFVALSLDYMPKWYQTIWFKTGLAALILGLLFAFYRYRIAQLEKQHAIRREIANDLHDDLGSTLNTVKVLTHLAKNGPERESYLDKIEESLVSASTGLRDMLWVLDDNGDTLQDLMTRICNAVLPVINAKGIRLDCKVEEELKDRVISKAEKRNLLLIAREAVNNSIKYAVCRNISITISAQPKISLDIADDGIGFDMELMSVTEGNGLKNMRYRAGYINYSVDIDTAPEQGVHIVVRKK